MRTRAAYDAMRRRGVSAKDAEAEIEYAFQQCFLEQLIFDRDRRLSPRSGQLHSGLSAKPGCRIKVHYIPSYCPHLDPIERLWGLMHRHVTHNRSHPSYNDFCRSVLHFLRADGDVTCAT